MRPIHTVASIALALASVAANAADPATIKAVEQRCQDLFADFAKQSGSKPKIEVKYAGEDPVKGHVIKGTVTHDGGPAQPIQCTFPLEAAPSGNDPAPKPPAK